MKLPCNYKILKFTLNNGTQKGFKCTDIGNIKIKERGIAIDEIKRKDPDGYPQFKDYNDPSKLVLYKQQIWYLPKRLEIFFARLIILEMILCELKEIKQENLNVFTELVSLNLNQNHIEVIEKGLFKFNTKLELISLNMNAIKFVDVNFVDDLKAIQFFLMLDNDCINVKADNSTKILKYLREKIINYCQNYGELEASKKLGKVGTQRGKYFWIYVSCGVVVGFFLTCAVLRIVYGVVKAI